VPQEEGNEGCQARKNEEHQTGNKGRLSNLWNNHVPDRQKLSKVKIYLTSEYFKTQFGKGGFF
jgi:hypothetical protein